MGIGLISAVMTYDKPLFSLLSSLTTSSEAYLKVLPSFLEPGLYHGEKKRRCCEAPEKGGQCSMRDTCSVLSALTFCWAVFPWVLQRPQFLQLFLVGGQHFFGEARAQSGWGAAQVRLSHSSGTWHLCKVREVHELCLWGDAAPKNPVAAKGGSCSLLGGDILHRLGEWNGTGSGQNAHTEGLNRKALVAAHFLRGVSAVKKLGATDVQRDMIFLSPSTGACIKSCFVCCLLWMHLICKNKTKNPPQTRYSVPLTAPSPGHH